MIQCPQCGQLNEPFFKFCLMCGASLVGAPSLARGPSRPEPAKPAAATPAAKPAAATPTAKPVVARAEPAVVAKPVVAPDPAPVVDSKPADIVAPESVVSHEPAAAAEEPMAPVAETPAASEPAAQEAAPVAAPEAVVSEHAEVAMDRATVEETPAAETPAESQASPIPDDDEELGAHEAPASTTAAPEPVVEAPAKAEPAPAKAEPAPAKAEPESAKPRRRTRFTLVVIREDASDGERFALDQGLFTVGREGTSVEFPDDVYLDSLHASVDVSEHAVSVVDQGSVNGTFLRLQAPVLLKHCSEVRIGQQLLRLEMFDQLAPIHVSTDGSDLLGGPVPESVWGRFVSVLAPDFDGDAFLLEGDAVQIGRERGDITFPGDGYVSGRHARLVRDGSGARLEDLGSSNGTYVRLTGPTPVKPGALILFGQQLFRLEG